MSYAVLLADGKAPEGVLTVNGLLLDGPCVQAQDLSMLVDDADRRGDSILIPGTAGVLLQPRRATARRVDVPFWLVGGLSWTGVEQDPKAGLLSNFETMRTGVGLGVASVTATIALTGGGSRTGQATPITCKRGQTRAGWWTPVVLSLELADGRLT